MVVRAVDHAHQGLRVERLPKNSEELRIGAGQLQAVLVAGDRNHRCPVSPRHRSQLFEDVEPAGDWQSQIDHHHIREICLHKEINVNAVCMPAFDLDDLLLGNDIRIARGALDVFYLDHRRGLKVRIGLSKEEHD